MGLKRDNSVIVQVLVVALLHRNCGPIKEILVVLLRRGAGKTSSASGVTVLAERCIYNEGVSGLFVCRETKP